jgi:hypothetical protein
VEASQEKRQEYLKEIEGISFEKLVYIDKSGVDMNDVKNRGWCKKGKILVGKKSGKYYERTNIIAGYVNKKSIAPMV